VIGRVKSPSGWIKSGVWGRSESESIEVGYCQDSGLESGESRVGRVCQIQEFVGIRVSQWTGVGVSQSPL